MKAGLLKTELAESGWQGAEGPVPSPSASWFHRQTLAEQRCQRKDSPRPSTDCQAGKVDSSRCLGQPNRHPLNCPEGKLLPLVCRWKLRPRKAVEEFRHDHQETAANHSRPPRTRADWPGAELKASWPHRHDCLPKGDFHCLSRRLGLRCHLSCAESWAWRQKLPVMAASPRSWRLHSADCHLTPESESRRSASHQESDSRATTLGIRFCSGAGKLAPKSCLRLQSLPPWQAWSLRYRSA